MQQLTLHLNHQRSNRWELRDGDTVILTFQYGRQQYITDQAEDLGPRWDEALERARKLADKRRDAAILRRDRG